MTKLHQQSASTGFTWENALNEGLELYWDSTYAIVVMLQQTYPDLSPEDVGLIQLAHLVESLPGFQDDSALVTDRILLDIQTEWTEETL
ncbi:MAG: Fe-S cluster assembly protein IscX [Anaerolineae bacterium]|nr:Fe-S cluster assembly protein IscX [Anaerolineae bacterium]